MYCLKCGAKLPEDAQFCSLCGVAQPQLPPVRADVASSMSGQTGLDVRHYTSTVPYEPSKLMAPPREATPGWRSIPIWAGVFVIVGGVLQGMGVNIQRYSNSDVAWGGLGVLIGGAVSIWFARRLRWWLLLYIPAIWIAMVPIALASELMTAGFFSRAGDQDASCRGWRHLNAELAPISTAISAYTNDLASATNPGSDDARRWAAAATSIRKQYEELDHPRCLIATWRSPLRPSAVTSRALARWPRATTKAAKPSSSRGTAPCRRPKPPSAPRAQNARVDRRQAESS